MAAIVATGEVRDKPEVFPLEEVFFPDYTNREQDATETLLTDRPQTDL